MKRYLLGVDPGWKNLGYAILTEEDGEFLLVKSGVENPSALDVDFPSHFRSSAVAVLQNEGLLDTGTYPGIHSVSIERYVPYNNTFSAEAENITMLIGGLREVLKPANLYRAIDWKTSLVKMLVKHLGFDNPSTSLDKKFSIAAAKHILNDQSLQLTDHECDSICLAAFPVLYHRYIGNK